VLSRERESSDLLGAGVVAVEDEVVTTRRGGVVSPHDLGNEQAASLAMPSCSRSVALTRSLNAGSSSPFSVESPLITKEWRSGSSSR